VEEHVVGLWLVGELGVRDRRHFWLDLGKG
jgi:hypothetical protein